MKKESVPFAVGILVWAVSWAVADGSLKCTVKEETNSTGRIVGKVLSTYSGQELRSKVSQIDADGDGKFDVEVGQVFFGGKVVCSWSRDRRDRRWARSFYCEGKEVVSEGDYEGNVAVVLLDTNRMPHTVLRVLPEGEVVVAEGEMLTEFQNAYMISSEFVKPVGQAGLREPGQIVTNDSAEIGRRDLTSPHSTNEMTR